MQVSNTPKENRELTCSKQKHTTKIKITVQDTRLEYKTIAVP